MGSIKMEKILVPVVIYGLKFFSFIFDIITFPIYVILQRPFSRQIYSRRVRAKPISFDENQITYHTVDEPGENYIRMLQKHIDTLEKMFRHVAKTHTTKRCLGTREILSEEDEMQPNGKVFKKYKMGEYNWRTYIETEIEAKHFGRGLREVGVQPKDNVVLFAETRAEWMIAAHGLFKQSCTIVTIYATLGEDGVIHGVNETEVQTIITSHELIPKLRKILKSNPKVTRIIYFEDQLQKTKTDGFGEVQLYSYSQVIQKGLRSDAEEVPPTTSDIAFIMYTSGSTGTPKGVLLSHQNCIATMECYADVEIFPNDIAIGFLPLAHVFELLAESVGLLRGVPIGYSTPNTLLNTSTKIMKGCEGDATVLGPTVMTTVPLILDRIAKAINDQVNKGTPLQKAIYKTAYDYKTKWIQRGFYTPLVDNLVFQRISKVIGGKLRVMLCGGAPLSPETHELIRVALCAVVVQGYGLTETTAGATISSVRDLTRGRVGAPGVLVDLRLINWEEGNYRITNKPYPQGEVVIGGETISPGYYKLPGKTAEEFFDEDDKRWFKTGDIGEIHPDGVLKIIDRKKDLVKLQAGEYVSLGKVESQIKTCSLVENICVYAESSKLFCVALIVANEKALKTLAASLGVTGDFEKLCVNPVVVKAAVNEISEHAKNCRLERFEIPQKITLCKEVWSPSMGLLTAAFKIKRIEIQKMYKRELEMMYA